MPFATLPQEVVVDVLPSETRLAVHIATPEELALEGLQKAVNGYIEVGFRYASAHRRGVKIVLLVDEDGLLKATRSTFFLRCLTTVNQYTGKARFVAEVKGPDGDTFVGLTPDEAADIVEGTSVVNPEGFQRILLVEVC